MIEDNGKFRISAWMAETIKVAALSVPAAKLLLFLIYFQDLEEDSWPEHLVDEVTLKQHFAFPSQFRNLGLATKSGSARFLRKPVEELKALGMLFANLEIAPCGKYLNWQFSEAAKDVMSAMDRYALLEAADVQHCSSRYDPVLLTQITLHRNMRMPQFSLIQLDPRFVTDVRSSTLSAFKAGYMTRILKPSLQKWADLNKHTYAVSYKQNGVSPGYTDVVVRIRHTDTRWPEGRFLKFDPRSHVYLIEPSASKNPVK